MGTVHDDRRHDVEHVGDVSEVHHEVVIAHHITTLCQPYLLGPCIAGFLHGIAHVTSTEELCLLDVDDASCLCRSDQQVRLSAEEGRYLYHIAYLSHRFCLPGFVDICQYLESKIGFDVS